MEVPVETERGSWLFWSLNYTWYDPPDMDVVNRTQVPFETQQTLSTTEPFPPHISNS